MAAIGGISPSYQQIIEPSSSEIQELIDRATSLDLDFNPKMLSNKDHPEFKEIFSEVIEVLDNGTLEEQIEKLQEIAYRYLANSHNHLIRISDHLSILRVLFYVEQPNVADIASVLLGAVEEKLTRKLKDPISRVKEEAFKTYAEETGDPEQKISISHGGGSRYLTAFLNGENRGYTSEAEGIFVSINSQSRDFEYARRTPLWRFDTPAILTAQIAAKYLYIVNHNGDYEAVIKPEDADKIEVKTIRRIDLRSYPFEERREWLTAALEAPSYKTGKPEWLSCWEGIREQYKAERLERFNASFMQVAGIKG